jgi:hypothetical protein
MSTIPTKVVARLVSSLRTRQTNYCILRTTLSGIIAIPLYKIDEYRMISLRVILQKMGAVDDVQSRRRLQFSTKGR